ncbi:MAG TPA: hypothetical protein VN033_11305 [Vulgatibacter sp.]|nr:hypothetical protein [Vulgatibacter sp.]
MKSTWILAVSCLAAGAIAIGCGGSDGGGGGGSGGGGSGGSNGTNTCTEDSVPGALVGACELEGVSCQEYRGSSVTAAQIEAICNNLGITFRTTPCEKGDDYLGTCRQSCGTPDEWAFVHYSMGGLLTEDELKESCGGLWVK